MMKIRSEWAGSDKRGKSSNQTFTQNSNLNFSKLWIKKILKVLTFLYYSFVLQLRFYLKVLLFISYSYSFKVLKVHNAVRKTAVITANTKVHISSSQKYISVPFPELGFLMEPGFLILFTASSVTTTILYKFLPGFVFYASWPGTFNYKFPDKDSGQQLVIWPMFLKK